MPYINKDFIEDLIKEIRIEDFFQYQYEAKKQGANYKMKSPFTDENTASFIISPAKQIWKDFSSGKGGRLINFVMEKENLSFVEAIEYLARYANKEVVYDDSEKAKAMAERKQKQNDLRPILSSALNKYRKEISNEKAQAEIKKRGYTEDDVIEWQIGYAPGDKFITNEVKKIGRLRDAQQLGLVSEKEYDSYWDRLIYPIRDKNGLLVGFAGRDLSGKEKGAKWINPKESILYNKEKIWFGLDKALPFIRQERTAFLVEGYNDVIAFHKVGLCNTVASCGTAITEKQLKELRNYTDKVVLCMDGDKAGVKAIEKQIPILLKLDFVVEVCILPDELDPDDFCRNYYSEIEETGIQGTLTPYFKNGFRYLLDVKLKEVTETQRTQNVRYLCGVINGMGDEVNKEIYTNWLTKESKFSKTLIKDIIKGVQNELESREKRKDIPSHYYDLPDIQGLKEEDVLPDIEKYKMFQANNRIYMLNADDTTFRYISNFSIEIIQHMADDQFPKKLVRVKNVHGLEKIFDTESSNLLTPLNFEKAVTNQGNFNIDISAQQLTRLKRYLFDKMGDGRKIDILGWQPDGKFWAWNNSVYVPGEGNKEITNYGVFKHNNTSYYIPSANEVYKNDGWAYSAQKKFVLKGATSFTGFSEKMRAVHQDHSISALLYSVAAIFQDIIVDKASNFPILFLYGQSGTGKSQITLACQSLFGIPQAQTNLEQGLSTGKANVRLFAQFQNSLCILNEYMVGNKDIEGLLKSLYDRDGYNRGNLQSKVSTETVPILSAAILTGNYMPNVESTMSRLVFEEIQRDKFSIQDRKNFDEMEDMMKGGFSNITNELLQYRSEFEESFVSQYRLSKNYLAKRDKLKDVKGRLIQNVAVLAATAKLLEDKYRLPFTPIEMMNHFEKIIYSLHTKMNANSITSKFWDVFTYCIRKVDTSKIEIDKEFNSEGDIIFFNFTNIYNKVQLEWWPRFHETCPSKMQLKKELEKSDAFHDKLSSKPLGSGRGATNTSVIRFDISKLENYDIIAETIEQLKYNLNLNEYPFSNSPATPIENNDKANNEEGGNQAEFPF